MGILKESLQHEVHLFEPKSLENAFIMARKVESKNMATRRVSLNTYREVHVTIHNLNQSIWLDTQQMDVRRSNGLCFNCIGSIIFRV